MQASLVFRNDSVAKTAGALALLAGKANVITGRLNEGMEYAGWVEFGTRRLAPGPMAHMRPAMIAVMPRVGPKIAAVLKQMLDRGVKGLYAQVQFDEIAMDAVAAAMYEFEAERVAALQRAVYTAERWRRNRPSHGGLLRLRRKERKAGLPLSEYEPHRLTTNLLNNRWIDVYSDAGHARTMGQGQLGKHSGKA